MFPFKPMWGIHTTNGIKGTVIVIAWEYLFKVLMHEEFTVKLLFKILWTKKKFLILKEKDNIIIFRWSFL